MREVDWPFSGAVLPGIRVLPARLWLPDPAAVDLASQYGIHLSHPTQLRLFLNLFGLEELEREPEAPRTPGSAVPRGEKPLEYELVLPMKADSEVVAARVAEEVAAFASVDSDTVDRIKMAIIEACINAFEHANCRDEQLHLTFRLGREGKEREWLEVEVLDRGPGFPPDILARLGQRGPACRPRRPASW